MNLLPKLWMKNCRFPPSHFSEPTNIRYLSKNIIVKVGGIIIILRFIELFFIFIIIHSLIS